MAHRRRADPLVSLCSVFESIINDMRDVPNVSDLDLSATNCNDNCVVEMFRDAVTVSTIPHSSQC